MHILFTCHRWHWLLRPHVGWSQPYWCHRLILLAFPSAVASFGSQKHSKPSPTAQTWFLQPFCTLSCSCHLLSLSTKSSRDFDQCFLIRLLPGRRHLLFLFQIRRCFTLFLQINCMLYFVLLVIYLLFSDKKVCVCTSRKETYGYKATSGNISVLKTRCKTVTKDVTFAVEFS